MDNIDGMGEPEKQPKIQNQTLLFLWEVTKVVVISLAIIIPVRYFLIQPFYVKGTSMEPNFHQYEYLIIDEISYRFHEPERGDVVVLRNPQQPSQFFIKRVIGLPGEHVEIKNYDVFIDGEQLDESAYLDSSVETWGSEDLVLGDDEYYMMGDNRPASLDSRVFKAIDKSEMIGRTWVRAWPLKKWSTFPPVEYNI